MITTFRSFHARSGSDRARFRLDPIGKMDGNLPKQHLALVLKWASLHEADLLENWRRLRTQEPPLRIAPLE